MSLACSSLNSMEVGVKDRGYDDPTVVCSGHSQGESSRCVTDTFAAIFSTYALNQCF